MPPDWDVDSPALRRNLAGLLQSIEENAPQRKPPAVETASRWHVDIMRGLQAGDSRYVGALREFEQRLRSVAGYLDDLVPPGAELNADRIAAIGSRPWRRFIDCSTIFSRTLALAPSFRPST